MRAITIAASELLQRIRKRQFGLRRYWAVQAKLSRRSGTRCLGLRSPREKGSVLCSVTAHLHQSPVEDDEVDGTGPGSLSSKIVFSAP